jgi:hypothetical protein
VLRRIRSLEAHVADIRHTQTTISNTLSELVSHLRAGSYAARSPSTYPPSFHQASPNINSPSMSTPTATHQHINEVHPSPPGGPTSFPAPHGQVIAPPRQSRTSASNATYQASSLPPASQPSPSGEFQPPLLPPTYVNYVQGTQPYSHATPGPQGPILPPFSSISTMGPPTQQGNVSSLRYQTAENAHTRSMARNLASGSKRQAPPSNVTSADSSDLDDEENGELPASGLVAPWEVLRGLADVAIERAAKVSGHQASEVSDFSPS